jgi:hypothetical protein
MTTLTLCEYRDIGSTARGSVAIPLEPPIAEQSIELGLTSQQSKSFAPDTCLIKLMANGDCNIAIGQDPDATNSVRHVAAGREQVLAVPANSKLKIAAMAAGSNNMTDNLGAFLTVVANPAAAQKTMADLKTQAATIDAAAKNLRDATAAAARGRTLAGWEEDLNRREKTVTALDAKLKAKDAAIADLLT